VSTFVVGTGARCLRTGSVQYSTVQYSTVQYSTVQYSPYVPHSKGSLCCEGLSTSTVQYSQ